MKVVITYIFLILILGLTSVECSNRETVIKQVLNKKSTLTSLSPGKAVEETIKMIYQDIKALNGVFPQLAEIELANVGLNSFRYEYGFIDDGKMKGPSFEKNGCGVYVEIEYPIYPDNLTQLKSYDYPDINLRFWRLVRADPNSDYTKEFNSTVNEIISNRMNTLIQHLKDGKK
ncbi:MAG: hypothetical protein HZA49_04725 [Planctomycetes bacterium]|nr:hypothetical protein [Planctomycetota bacterium]